MIKARVVRGLGTACPVEMVSLQTELNTENRKKLLDFIGAAVNDLSEQKGTSIIISYEDTGATWKKH